MQGTLEDVYYVLGIRVYVCLACELHTPHDALGLKPPACEYELLSTFPRFTVGA